jgi:DNA replication protein DnaC
MISNRKLESEKAEQVANCVKKCGGKGCPHCFKHCALLDAMAAAEVPVDYWNRYMKGFYGDPDFKKAILYWTNEIDRLYKMGYVLCFVGPRGTGKTMAACCMLRTALHSKRNYTAYYTTMADAVSRLLAPGSYSFRNVLKSADFLVVDEVDQRFFPSPGSRELYGNHFENIIRMRTQNRLPTVMCTNSEDISQIFGGEFEKSFASLRAQFVIVLRAGGKDARQNQEQL